MFPLALMEFGENHGWQSFAAAPPASFAGQQCQPGRSSICNLSNGIRRKGKQSKSSTGGGLLLGAAAVLVLQLFSRGLHIANRFVSDIFEKSIRR